MKYLDFMTRTDPRTRTYRTFNWPILFICLFMLVGPLHALHENAAPGPEADPLGERTAGSQLTLFPAADPFRALLASVKEPRTHMTWQRLHIKEGDFNVGSVGFGESFGLFRWTAPENRYALQVGISGAVFAQFNLDAASMDLINADYIVGFPVTYRRGRWSGRMRLFHQSSHLGDEFLLFPQAIAVERINLSFEMLEYLGSFDWRQFRVYGGGGYIVHSDTPLDRYAVQAGMEYASDVRIWKSARLVGGVDLRWWDETAWDTNLSAKVGLEFLSPVLTGRSLQFLLQYFSGNLPYGQFYDLKAQYVGVGITFAFGQR